MLFHGIELADNAEIKNLVVERLSSNPTGLGLDDRGRIIFNTTTSAINMWTGSSWVAMSGVTNVSNGVSSFNSRTGAVTLTSGDVNAVIGAISLPVASGSVLGGIKVGSGLTISSGVLSVNSVTPQIPAGTKMLFAQPTAPTGWTQITSSETQNRMLRVVSTVSGSTGSGGSGGYGYGGIDEPTIMDKVPSHSHNFSGNTNTTGAHTHTYSYRNSVLPQSGSATNCWTGTSTGTTSSDGSHFHTISGTTEGNAGSSNWNPKYLNLILASKN
ncbi:MAG: hypothetical protein ACXW2E_00870 [Nitrososphaeraceae archaeon]